MNDEYLVRGRITCVYSVRDTHLSISDTQNGATRLIKLRTQVLGQFYSKFKDEKIQYRL